MHLYLLRRLLVSIPDHHRDHHPDLPGDARPARAIRSRWCSARSRSRRMSAADQARFRADLGLDQPLHVQYLEWMAAVARGDLGRSFWRNDTVARSAASGAADHGPDRGDGDRVLLVRRHPDRPPERHPARLLAGSRRAGLSTLFLAIPSFWLGVAVVLVGVLYFSWRPPIEVDYLWTDPCRNLQMTIGPALALGAGPRRYVARITRSSMLELLHADFVRTARAKGLAEKRVIWRHVFVNAVLPVVTLSGLILAGLLGGSVAVETAFGVPGLGTALVRALADRDYMVVQNLVLVYAVIFTAVNLCVDLAYGWLDPRIRYE